jgi:hypothetical protein
MMERNTLKLLGVTLRNAMPLEDNKNSKDLRRLIVQVERRQRELDGKRDEQFQTRFGGEFIDPKDGPKWPGSRR